MLLWLATFIKKEESKLLFLILGTITFQNFVAAASHICFFYMFLEGANPTFKSSMILHQIVGMQKKMEIEKCQNFILIEFGSIE